MDAPPAWGHDAPVTVAEPWLRNKPGVKWRRIEPDVIQAWVADMYFPTPAPVARSIQ
jgi:bifunctional pyridoxal-dependent enzyme with beta-cystathionase and maltose regulon repressor activities